MLDTLINLENCLLESNQGKFALENRIDKQFLECGKTGLIYDYKSVLQVLNQQLSPKKITLLNPQYIEIEKDAYLLTYTTSENGQMVWRSSIWRNNQANWSILYHQATPILE